MDQDQLDILIAKMNQTFMARTEEIKEEFAKQTHALTENFYKNMGTTLDEKLNPLMEENNKLKNEVSLLKEKIYNLEKKERKNNIILHGIEEQEDSNSDLMDVVLKTLNVMTKAANIENFDKWEISEAYRLGRKDNKKKRPILIKLTLAWRRLAILQNNKHFPENMYATEDFPKDILQVRKELKDKQQEEIKKGNLAIIRYDKLIIKKNNQRKTHDKRKRSPTKTPENTRTNRERVSQIAPNKINKINKLESTSRSRTNSLSEMQTPKN